MYPVALPGHYLCTATVGLGRPLKTGKLPRFWDTVNSAATLAGAPRPFISPGPRPLSGQLVS